MNQNVGFFPGSFDPITLGHYSIIQRGAKLFDRFIVGMGVNTSKTYLFSFEQRMKWLEAIGKEFSNVEVVAYEGLTVDVAAKHGVTHLLRGLRNSVDFNYESNIEKMNRVLNPNIETVCLFTENEYAGINANIVREIYKSGGDISPFVPKSVMNDLK